MSKDWLYKKEEKPIHERSNSEEVGEIVRTVVKDKNGDKLAISDKIVNSKGEIRRLENIGGLAFGVLYDEYTKRIKNTCVIRKLNISKEWEKVS